MIRLRTETPDGWVGVREAVVEGIFNLVAFVTPESANFNVNILSVGFRVTLSRHYCFIGVGALGFAAGAYRLSGGTTLAPDSTDF